MKINSEQMLNELGQPILHKTHCYKQPGVSLYAEDCLETLKKIETGSIDFMLQDPPYGVLSAMEWDKAPLLPEMWAEWERVLKPNGAWVFTATQPFASSLITSRAGFFKYEIIWRKNKIGNFLNAKIQPLRNHENILVFYRMQPTYNPIKRKLLNSITKSASQSARNTKAFSINPENAATKELIYNKKAGEDGFPFSVIDIDFESDAFDSSSKHQDRHPTQKPLELMRYLIKTYSNENDLVFDGYSGSGTTAAACIKEKRNFIGSEMNKEYFDLSVKRLSQIIKQPELPW